MTKWLSKNYISYETNGNAAKVTILRDAERVSNDSINHGGNMNHYFTHFNKIFRDLELLTSSNFSNIVRPWDIIPEARKSEVFRLPNFPHSNVWLSKDTNELTLEFALAGYTEDEVSVTASEGILHISAEPADSDDSAIEMHRGISRKNINFSLNVERAYDTKKAKTSFANGILSIKMKKGKDQEAVKLM